MVHLEEIRQYWNSRAEGYSAQVNEGEGENNPDLWKERLAAMNLGCGEGKKALDLGCGPGLFSVVLTELGYEVISFDYSEEMLAQTKQNMQAKGFEAKCVQGDAQNLPFEDESFDLIISRNLMWNLENPRRAYEEWFRVVKTGGSIINNDGNHYAYMYNEEYRKEREQENYYDGHKPEYMVGINTSLIENIAKELPLSSIMRPTWDVDVLTRLAAVQINISTQYTEFVDKEGCSHRIIKRFIIHALK